MTAPFPPVSSMKTVVSVLACALAVGCKKAESAAPAPPPPKVQVVEPSLREIADYGEHTGYLDAAKTVEVRSRVRGHLQKVHFEDGQKVEAGQLLFELDPRPFQADVDRAKALVVALQAQQEATEKERARQESLLGRGGASQSLVDKLTADVAALGAQVAAQEQEVARLMLDLEYSRITSPIAGRIGRAILTEGNLVNAGGSDPLLATIVSTDPVYLYFTVDERALQLYQKRRRDAGRERPEKLQIEIQFGLDTDEGFPRTAMLDFADVRVDPGTGTITLRATVADPQNELVPGSRVGVRIAVSEPRQAVAVPDRAVLADQDRRYLLVVGDDQLVQRLDVRLGRLLDDGVREVVPRDPGAPPIDGKTRVIVEGLLRARLGKPVDVAEQEANGVR